MAVTCLIGCGRDDRGAADPLATGAPDVLVQRTVSPNDSIFGIANSLCVDPSAIVAANGWIDGLDHPLHPGDVIATPSSACGSPPTAGEPPKGSPSITVGAAVVYEPFEARDLGDGFAEYRLPACEPAYTALVAFIQTDTDQAVLIEALGNLGQAVPDGVVAGVDSFRAFRDRWLDLARGFDATYGFADGYEARQADPDYVRMASEIEAGRSDGINAVWTYVDGLCEPSPSS